MTHLQKTGTGFLYWFLVRVIGIRCCICWVADDVVVRLLNAFAEEQATEDAVYYMGEALRKGVVELDVFLKVTTITLIFVVHV